MKKILISILLLVSPLLAIAGVSINIGQPNYYGQIQIGNERPQLLYAQPVIIQRGRVQQPPVYIRVPSDQSRNWRRYCGGYNLCGRQVYFVNDNWYRNTYAPRYRHQHHYKNDYGRRPHIQPYPDRGRHDNRKHHGNDRNKHYDRGHKKGHDNYNRDKRH